MGVKNLWKILGPCGKRVSLEYKTLAIDTSIWLYQYRNLPTSLIIFSLCKRIFRILYNQIKPVFIFDGKPPAIKQKVLEERRKINLKMLLKRYLENKKCEICNLNLRECKHINKQNFEELNEKAFDKLRNHDLNWGELSDEEDFDEYFDNLYSNHSSRNSSNLIKNEGKSIQRSNSQVYIPVTEGESYIISNKTVPKSDTFFDNSVANFDPKNLERLSKTEQLSVLIDLRLKRKLPMYCDVSNSTSFSNSQIENVKKRNHITTLIRNLNKDANKRINSDCSTFAVLNVNKEKDISIFQNFCSLEDQNVVLQEEKSENTKEDLSIEELFDSYTNDKWETEYEKYDKPKIIDYSRDQTIKYNQFLLKNAPKEVSHTGLPKIHQESTSTVQSLSNELQTENISESTQEDSVDSCNFEILEKYLGDLSEELESADFIDKPKKSEMKTDFAVLESNNDSDIKRIKSIFIDVLKIFELPFIESIGEADLQCWDLFKNGLIDGVISEDSDMIIYGTTVYKNFFRKDKDILEFSLGDIEEKLHLNKDDLIKLGYLLGCDYCEGQRGIGIKRAVERIKTVNDEEIAFLKEIYSENKNAVKVDTLKFGTLNKFKFNFYLVEKGLDKAKVDELMVYMRKVQEIINE